MFMLFMLPEGEFRFRLPRFEGVRGDGEEEDDDDDDDDDDKLIRQTKTE
jgi:hypothetical protein